MKKIFTIVAISMAFTFAASAQNTQLPSQSAPSKKEMKANIKNELNLTQDQQAQWKSLNKEYKDKMMAIKNNTSLSPNQRKQQFKDLSTEKKSNLNAILTPDQQAKLATMKKQHGAKFKHNMQALNLSQDQKTQWKNINQEYRTKMTALQNDKTLTDDARKAQYKSLAQEKNNKIKSILNEDQQKKLAELKKERHRDFKNKSTTVVSDNMQVNS